MAEHVAIRFSGVGAKVVAARCVVEWNWVGAIRYPSLVYLYLM